MINLIVGKVDRKDKPKRNVTGRLSLRGRRTMKDK